MNKQINEFIELAKKRNVTLAAMVEAIRTVQSGRRMSDKARNACDFLGEENTFWNSCAYLDYNWFIDNYKALKANW